MLEPRKCIENSMEDIHNNVRVKKVKSVTLSLEVNNRSYKMFSTSYLRIKFWKLLGLKDVL